MAVHHALRELVERIGPGVLGDADTLLGTLDDYLEDGDADPAALTLLADAARHGALTRLTDLLDHGAEPTAAVATSGGELATRRGTDERAAHWAVAALGYAAGRLPDQLADAALEEWRSGMPTRPGPPVPPPASTAPPPSPAPLPPAPVQTTPVQTAPVRRTVVAGEPIPDGEHDRGDDGEDSVRRRFLPALLAVLLLAAAGLGGWLVLQDRRDRDPVRDGEASDAGGPASSGTGGVDASADGSDTDDDGSGTGTDSDPTPSPGNRSYVAYANRASGVSRVHVLDVGSGNVRTLSTEGNASQPSVSADGRTVAFILETSQGKRLAVSRGDQAPLLLDVGREPTDPAISPDGSAVAYVTETEHGKDVSLRRLAQTEAVVVAGGTADEFDPAWSDDGSHLAYVLTGSSDDSIVLVDAASGAETSRTVAAGHASSPALSPSGDEIAYVASVQGNAEVVVTSIGADDAAPANVTQSADTEIAVVWLADDQLVTSAPGRGLAAITVDSPAPEALTSGTSDSL